MKLLFKILLQFLFFCFPWFIRRRFLIFFFKYEIDKTAKIGFSIFLCDSLVMKANSSIHSFVLVKKIDKVCLNCFSQLGGFNFITGLNAKNPGNFKNVKSRNCELVLGVHSRVTTRHFFDCNGGIYIGDFTTIAGSGSQFLTHSIDVYKNIQDVAPINIGNYCFVGTKSIILKGSTLPNFCILGAGSILLKSFSDEYSVYGGNPAKKVKNLEGLEISYFERLEGNVE